jgi:hypothetical protein
VGLQLVKEQAFFRALKGLKTAGIDDLIQDVIQEAGQTLHGALFEAEMGLELRGGLEIEIAPIDRKDAIPLPGPQRALLGPELFEALKGPLVEFDKSRGKKFASRLTKGVGGRELVHLVEVLEKMKKPDTRRDLVMPQNVESDMSKL